MSDRILVMRDGQLAGELPPGSTEEEILRLATGARVPGADSDSPRLTDTNHDGGARLPDPPRHSAAPVPEDGGAMGGTA